MFTTLSAIYGLKLQSRCIASHLANQESHEFFVGTISKKQQNEVHLVEFEEESTRIACRGIFNHPREIWEISSSPTSKGLFFTVSCDLNTGSFQADLCRIPETYSEESSEDLLIEATIDAKEVRKVIWDPHENASRIMSLGSDTVHLWDVQGSSISHVSQFDYIAPQAIPEGQSVFQAGCWDPHHSSSGVLASHKSILTLDLRTMSESMRIDDAHADRIEDVDYNPNKPYHIVSGGRDRLVKFWDLRKADKPLVVLSKHSHWVTKVRFNRFHDQLVLSSGSDSSVNLWSVVSVSSAPLGDLEDPANEKEGDKLINTYDEHEESVYSIDWSCCDAWIFASLSYDGRVVINHVPPAEKYKILL